MIKLSVLICSLESRKNVLARLLFSLMRQLPEICNSETDVVEGCAINTYTFPEVEIIVATDNKRISTGAKRNLQLRLAKGYRVIWIDDDDGVAPEYFREILLGCEQDVDAITFNGWIETNGANRIEWRISKDYDNVTITDSGRPIYLRSVNHIAAVKRSIAIEAGGFPDKSNAEDAEYSRRITPYLQTEYRIEKQLYFYHFSTHHKEYK